MCVLADRQMFGLRGNASNNRALKGIAADHTTHERQGPVRCHREIEGRIVRLVSSRARLYAIVLKRPSVSVARSAHSFASSSDSATVDSGSLWPETKARKASMSSAAVLTSRAMFPCWRVNGFGCGRLRPRCDTLHPNRLRRLSKRFVDEGACPFLAAKQTPSTSAGHNLAPSLCPGLGSTPACPDAGK